jgi:hypothetical protein
MGLTFAPGLPPLILSPRMPSTKESGGVLGVCKLRCTKKHVTKHYFPVFHSS